MSTLRAWLRITALAAALLPAILSVGCGGDESESVAAPETDRIGTEIERGPVKVIASVTPGSPRLSDNPEFTLTVEAVKGVDVRMPPFGDSIGGFIIRNFRQPVPEMIESRQVIRQIYELEPARTGEHLIHPITIPFVDNRPEGDGREHLVETEGFTVVVQSVLGEAVPSLTDLKPPAGPRELPAETFNAAWLLLAVPPAAAAVLFVMWNRRRRGTEAAAPQLSPRELAWLELKALVDAGYLEREEFQAYYAELTAVVRRFIERTTGVRAPEQTTEEFLRETGSRETFPEQERERLKFFLEAADLVKFAAQKPGKEEIESSFDRAKEFVGIGEAGAEVAGVGSAGNGGDREVES